MRFIVIAVIIVTKPEIYHGQRPTMTNTQTRIAKAKTPTTRSATINSCGIIESLCSNVSNRVVRCKRRRRDWASPASWGSGSSATPASYLARRLAAWRYDEECPPPPGSRRLGHRGSAGGRRRAGGGTGGKHPSRVSRCTNVQAASRRNSQTRRSTRAATTCGSSDIAFPECSRQIDDVRLFGRALHVEFGAQLADCGLNFIADPLALLGDHLAEDIALKIVEAAHL
jgi:hypothetical protein